MTILSVGVLGVIPVLAKPPGATVLGEVTFTAGEKSGFFTELILPLGGNQTTHYGVYAQGYGNIGVDSPAGNAGGYVHFSNIPIKQCGTIFFGGVNTTSQTTGRVRVVCQF